MAVGTPEVVKAAGLQLGSLAALQAGLRDPAEGEARQTLTQKAYKGTTNRKSYSMSAKVSIWLASLAGIKAE